MNPNKSIKAPLSLLFFFLNGEMKIDGCYAVFKWKRLLANIVPIDEKIDEIKLGDINSVDLIRSFRMQPIMIGLILYVAGLTYARGGATLAGMIIVVFSGLLTFSGIMSGIVLRRDRDNGGDIAFFTQIFFKSQLVKMQAAIETEKYGEITEKTRKMTEMRKRDFVREVREQQREEKQKTE